MPYTFKKNRMYRMPTHFGPICGPRQGPNGRQFANVATPNVTSLAVSFKTPAQPLEAFLPPGFEIDGEPIVTVRASYISDIEWLAGRGYNTLGVSFPATFTGKQDVVHGNFLLVLWENLADPIITGREELGFSKIYCELPEPRYIQGVTHCIASWMGFKFLDLTLSNMKQLSSTDINNRRQNQRSTGTLHYKYQPRTGDWGTPDVVYPTFTPSAGSNSVIKEMWAGDGVVQFHKATWEDLPTMFNIVNAFHTLEILEYSDATITKSVGGKDLGDQRILS